MPKRVGFLYDKMCDREFIRIAIIHGARHKHKRWDVKMVLDDIEHYVDLMYDIVTTYNYTPTQPKEKFVYDPSSEKTRPIGVQPFYPDGIIQQMEVMAMQPVLMRGMHHWCCASIPGRGGNRALNYAKRIVQRKRKKARYAAELDVHHFYPSTPQIGIVKALSRKIKDKKFLLLVAITFSCYAPGQKYATEYGLTPEEIVGDTIGMYIGFFLNQWLENYYLETLDQHILRLDGVNFMYRYMDNINLFSSNKRKLHRAITSIAEFMKRRLRLEMKHNWQLYPTTKRMLSTVGYRIAHDYVILRKRNFLRFTRQCRKVLNKLLHGFTVPFKMAAGLLSRIGQLKHCNSHYIRVKYVDPIKVKRLKDIVRAEAQRRRTEQLCAGREVFA